MSWKENENKLFEHLKENYIKDLEWSKVAFSHYDCFSLDKECDIELKCRNKHYDDLVIEKYKYDKLIARAQKFLTIPVYICQTPKGIFAFNLAALAEPIWETRGMPKTSHFSNRQFVDKEVGYLHIHYAKRYD
jgi:hypothetical protein